MNEESSYLKESQRAVYCWEHSIWKDDEWAQEGDPKAGFASRR